MHYGGGVRLSLAAKCSAPALYLFTGAHPSRFFGRCLLPADRNLTGVLSALSIAERKEGGVDAHGYNACITGMAKAKRWADALALLQRMRAAGVAPNTACYSNAIVVGAVFRSPCCCCCCSRVVLGYNCAGGGVAVAWLCVCVGVCCLAAIVSSAGGGDDDDNDVAVMIAAAGAACCICLCWCW